MIRYIILSLLAYALIVPAEASELPSFNNGHIKTFFLLNTFPDDSVFREQVDTPSTDFSGDLRLNFEWDTSPVSLFADYQLIASHGDSIIIANAFAGSPVIAGAIPNDDNRLFDLTHIVSRDNNQIIAHRLDRLYADLTGKNLVVRFGRQAISWGNGLMYSPMDFFNPFDPSAIDTEYKTGDDMLYGQFLQDNGNDLQTVWVIRRDNNHHVNDKNGSIAIKYHGFIGDNEFDILVSEHYEDTIIGVGGIVNLGGAIWRGDITLTDTQAQNATSLVTSLSYSWLGWGHNISGIIEYFHNGFGQSNSNYSPAALPGNPDLLKRLDRGELFTLGQNYIAASATIEVTPLWILTPNIFININDDSIFAQLVSTYDLKQEWRLHAALSIPTGKAGTEFGGIDSGIIGKQLSTELNIYAQLSWYF